MLVQFALPAGSGQRVMDRRAHAEETDGSSSPGNCRLTRWRSLRWLTLGRWAAVLLPACCRPLRPARTGRAKGSVMPLR